MDDFVTRFNRLKFLCRGYPSMVFWLLTLVSWLFVLGAMAIAFTKNRMGIKMPFNDSVWFAYITLTTVGLGDIFIPHEEFRAIDMFYLPLMFLIGFVLLANFLRKLSSVVVSSSFFSNWEQKSLEEILEKSRKSRNHDQSPRMSAD